MQKLLLLATRLARTFFEHFWLIAAALFVSSAIGWNQYLAAHPFNGSAANQHTVWDALAFTVMLAPLRAPTVYGPDVPWLLNLGRLLLPFVFVGGIFKVTALRTAAERHISRWFARTLREHSVVCGLSQSGVALVCELLRMKRWVIVIDVKPVPDKLSQLLQTLAPAERDRLVLLDGDATSTLLLQAAGAHHARDVYAVSEDDFVNMDIATAVRSLMMGKSGPVSAAPAMHVHLKDFVHRESFHEAFKPFDSRALAARQVVTHFPADGPWLASRKFDVGPHAIVIGLGGMGEQVIKQLASSAHYACNKRLTITVVDTSAAKLEKQFFERFRMLAPTSTPADFGIPSERYVGSDFPLSEVMMFDGGIDQFCHSEFHLACTRRGLPGAIYVCVGNDIECDRISRMVVVALERARISGPPDADQSAQCSVVKLLRRLTPAGQRSGLAHATRVTRDKSTQVVEIDVLRWAANAVINDSWIKLARGAHADYAVHADLPVHLPAIAANWDALTDETRQMNLNTVCHHLVRIREAGVAVSAADLLDDELRLSSANQAEISTYINEHQEEFAAAEHRRWLCDKLMFGWRYTSGTGNIASAKLNKNLVAYDNLTDEVKDYDRQNVQAWSRLLSTSG